MSHLLYLMFRCDGDVMESLDFGKVFGHLNTPLLLSQPLHENKTGYQIKVFGIVLPNKGPK